MTNNCTNKRTGRFSRPGRAEQAVSIGIVSGFAFLIGLGLGFEILKPPEAAWISAMLVVLAIPLRMMFRGPR